MVTLGSYIHCRFKHKASIPLTDITPREQQVNFCLLSDMQLAPPVPDSEGESDASDRIPVPSFQNSFSQAFEEALQQMDRGPDGTAAAAAAQPVVIPGEGLLEPGCA